MDEQKTERPLSVGEVAVGLNFRHGSSGLERASLCARRSPSVSNDKPTGRNETSSAWSI